MTQSTPETMPTVTLGPGPGKRSAQIGTSSMPRTFLDQRFAKTPTSIVSLLSETTPLISASVLFFLLIGLLPTVEYGLFVTVTASAMIVTPIARAGAAVVLLRDVGRGRDDQASWSDALSTTLVTTSLTVLVWLGIGRLVVPEVSTTASLTLFWQQLAPMAVSDLAVAFFVVKGEMVQSLYARITFACWRVAGLLAFWVIGSESLDVLGPLLLGAGLAGALQNVLRVGRRFALVPVPHVPSWQTITRGVPDSVSAATGSVLDSIDRPILTRAGFVIDTARYGVAMRLVSLAGVSTLALLRPFDKETFTAGATSVTSTTSVMIRASRRTFPTALLSAAGLWVLAGWLPQLLPADYAESTEIIRWAVWMMPMRALSFPFGNVLTAAGLRMIRLYITAAAAVGNVIGNLILIPTYSWRAAVATTLAAEMFMVVTTMLACGYFVRRERMNS